MIIRQIGWLTTGKDHFIIAQLIVSDRFFFCFFFPFFFLHLSGMKAR